MRRVEMTLTLGTQLGIDRVHSAFEGDGCVWAVELACAANRTLRSNDLVCHNPTLLRPSGPRAVRQMDRLLRRWNEI